LEKNNIIEKINSPKPKKSNSCGLDFLFVHNDDVYPGGMRAKSLYSLIEKHKLDVSKIYTSCHYTSKKISER
jgi:hypothetical protein